MRRSARRGLVLTLTILTIATTAAAGRPSNEELASDARDAMARLQRRDTTLKAVLDSSLGYAIFPEVANGGFIFRGAGGHGEVYEDGRLVGRARISQETVGTQAEGQKFIELILFKRKSALTRFKKNRFELSAQAAAIGAEQGAAAQAKYADGVAIIVLPTAGATAEASVSGQKLQFIPLEGD
jgi:lipid-binding SYLF domain-containing protein